MLITTFQSSPIGKARQGCASFLGKSVAISASIHLWLCVELHATDAFDPNRTSELGVEKENRRSRHYGQRSSADGAVLCQWRIQAYRQRTLGEVRFWPDSGRCLDLTPNDQASWPAGVAPSAEPARPSQARAFALGRWRDCGSAVTLQAALAALIKGQRRTASADAGGSTGLRQGHATSC